MTANFSHQIKYFEVFEDKGWSGNEEYKNIENLRSFDTRVATISSKMVSIFQNLPCHTLKIKKNRMLKNNNIRSVKILFKLDYESYKIFNLDYQRRSLYLYINNENEISQGRPIILSPGY